MEINFTCVKSAKVQTVIAAETEVNQDQSDIPSVAENIASCEWYSSIIQFLQKLEVSPDLTPNQARAIELKSIKFCINHKMLYQRDQYGVLLRCLDKEEVEQVMHHFHSSTCGGHHYWKTTSHKILREGYYWSVLFSYVCTFFVEIITSNRLISLTTNYN